MACVSIVKILWTKIKKTIWKNKKKMKAKTIILKLGGIFKMMCGKLRRIEILQQNKLSIWKSNNKRIYIYKASNMTKIKNNFWSNLLKLMSNKIERDKKEKN